MKKVMSLVMVLVCFVAMAGCGEMKESDFEPGKLVKEDFALINTETGVKLTLGMTKKEIEKLIGEPTAESSWSNDYTDALCIKYRGDKAAIFIAYEDIYKTPRGIQPEQSKMSDVSTKYGKGVIDSDFEKEGDPGYNYFLNLKTKEMVTNTVNKEYANKNLPLKDIAMLSFGTDDGETVFSVVVSDGEANFNRE